MQRILTHINQLPLDKAHINRIILLVYTIQTMTILFQCLKYSTYFLHIKGIVI